MSCHSAALAASPLFSLLYGARDKNGIKRTLRETYKVYLVFSVAWCTILILLMPVLLRFYGMAGNPLSFELDNESFAKVGAKLVQKAAQRIDYSYLYKMNIITIDLAK